MQIESVNGNGTEWLAEIDAGSVDEDIDGLDRRCEPGDRRRIGEVGGVSRGLDAFERKSARSLAQTIRRPGDQMDFRALQPESAPHREPETGTAAGHKRALAPQIE
jgi:hypothetical protein